MSLERYRDGDINISPFQKKWIKICAETRLNTLKANPEMKILWANEIIELENLLELLGKD